MKKITEKGEYGFYKYTILSDNKIRITKYRGSEERITVPDRIMHYTVTEIGSGAFSYNVRITEVVLPSSVERIEQCSFCECVRLESINIPPLVKTIEPLTFEDCLSLSAVYLENTTCIICDNAFENSSPELIK